MKKLIFLFASLYVSSSIALTLDKVHTFGEEITECGLSRDSVTASLAGLMRYNRIPMGDSATSVTLYHQVTAIDMGNGCAAHINISFYTYEPKVFVPTLKRSLSADVVLCKLSSLLVGAKHSIQRRVNDEAKSLSEECLLRIDKK